MKSFTFHYSFRVIVFKSSLTSHEAAITGHVRVLARCVFEYSHADAHY